uniref:IG domain-containing protein n=1 Tax=Panagrellus redivivus TaxID=6233 RepID=A0A7E4ZTX1_PANRE
MALYCFFTIIIFLMSCCHGFPEKCTYNEVDGRIEITGNGKLNITFDEPRLKILISGSKIWVYYVICIGPAEVHVSSCPDGQGVVEFFERHATSKMFELDRDGNLWTGSKPTSAAKLKDAEFYTIYITQLQSDMTFTLLNAKIYVPKEEKDDINAAAAMSPAIITIIVLGSIMALIILGIVLFCIWRICMMKNQSQASPKKVTVDEIKKSKKMHSTGHVASTARSSMHYQNDRSSNQTSEASLQTTNFKIQK